MDKIIDIIVQHAGAAFFICVAAMVALVFMAWWARGMYERVRSIESLPCKDNQEKLKKQEEQREYLEKAIIRMEESVSKLPCSDHSSVLERHSGKHEDMQKSVTRIETILSYMQKSMENISQSLQHSGRGIIIDPFTQTQSPLSITQKGIEMINRLHVDKMFEKNWPRIHKLIEENVESASPYDIQQFCLEQAVVFPEKFLSEEELIIIKSDAYLNGLTITSYMRVIAVMARDRYFETHNIPLSVLDSDK